MHSVLQQAYWYITFYSPFCLLFSFPIVFFLFSPSNVELNLISTCKVAIDFFPYRPSCVQFNDRKNVVKNVHISRFKSETTSALISSFCQHCEQCQDTQTTNIFLHIKQRCTYATVSYFLFLGLQFMLPSSVNTYDIASHCRFFFPTMYTFHINCLLSVVLLHKKNKKTVYLFQLGLYISSSWE